MKTADLLWEDGMNAATFYEVKVQVSGHEM